MKFSPSLSLLATAFALAAGAAQAQVYMEATLGAGKVNGQCRGLSSCESSDLDSRLSLGYLISPNAGMEFSWLDYPTVKAGDAVNGARVKLSGPAFGGVYRHPLTDSVSLNLRGGLAWNQGKASVWENQREVLKSRQRSAQPYFGLNATYAFNETYAVGLGVDLTRAKLENERANIRSFNLVGRSTF